MNINDAYNSINTMKSDYYQNYKNIDSSKKEALKKLDQEYSPSIKKLTQDQRKIMLTILNPKKYGELDLKESAQRTVKGKEIRSTGKLKKLSRMTQNLFGSRISSKVIQRELHNWAQNESKKLSIEDF